MIFSNKDKLYYDREVTYINSIKKFEDDVTLIYLVIFNSQKISREEKYIKENGFFIFCSIIKKKRERKSNIIKIN